VTQHIAEKLHAVVRPRPVESSRVKDLVDILLFASLVDGLQVEPLTAAIQAVFAMRGDELPAKLEQIPGSWRPKFNQFAKSVDLPFSRFDQAIQAVQSFLNPVLNQTAGGIWRPETWEWSQTRLPDKGLSG